MKIAYLSFSPLKACVANAVHVMNMCSAFTANGHRTVLFARGFPRRGQARTLLSTYGVSHPFELMLRPKLRVKLLGRLCYAFLQGVDARVRIRADIYYARCVVSAAIVLLLRGPVVLELHEVPRNALERLANRFVLRHRRLRRLVVISQALLEDLAALYPDALGEVDCVVAPDGANASCGWEAFPLAHGPGRQIGYAGGLREGNGIGLMLELARVLPHDTFHLLGGTPAQITHWKQLQRSSNVVWYGRLPPARVPAFLAACDILLAPYAPGAKTHSGHDTSKWMSPLKIFEYMAAGKPMVVADYPVLREVLAEDLAELVEPANPRAWKQALDKLEDPLLRDRLGDAAQRALESRFTWNARARSVLQGIDEAPLRSARKFRFGRRLPAGSAPGPV